mmetsp:Transcript_8920/g.30694  ORF Transcript_8920/g.30694 Transcript_8920/m.30694 type:complete len:244 (-) Transcript_8920:116-847(-)
MYNGRSHRRRRRRRGLQSLRHQQGDVGVGASIPLLLVFQLGFLPVAEAGSGVLVHGSAQEQDRQVVQAESHPLVAVPRDGGRVLGSQVAQVHRLRHLHARKVALQLDHVGPDVHAVLRDRRARQDLLQARCEARVVYVQQEAQVLTSISRFAFHLLVEEGPGKLGEAGVQATGWGGESELQEGRATQIRRTLAEEDAPLHIEPHLPDAALEQGPARGLNLVGLVAQKVAPAEPQGLGRRCLDR